MIAALLVHGMRRVRVQCGVVVDERRARQEEVV